MKLVESIAAMTRLSARWPADVAFVPTMGALHDGHLSLIKLARRKVGARGIVVVSIFVNPLQFGPKEDLSRYPRPLARDLKLCRALGVDVVFHPSVDAMYPAPPTTFVDEDNLSQGLCGGARPGHFRGVCTVVAKLFQIVRPRFAVFGQKDYQQLAVVRRMVRDLNFPVEVIRGPTHRESDGLAMSSRNAYLSAEQRREAPALRQAIVTGARALRAGERDASRLQKLMRASFAAAAPDGRVDYLAVVDAENLSPLKTARGRVALLGAVFFERTRLIDNEIVKAPRA